MSVRSYFAPLAMLLIVAAGQLAAQQDRPRGFGGGRFGGGFGGFGGAGRLALLRVDEVQKEINLTSDQIQAVQDLRRELRGDQAGPGGGERPSFRDLSDEERRQLFEQRRAQAAERAEKERKGLSQILSADQAARLTGILAQVQGTAALLDPEIAERLKITDQQQEQIRDVNRQANESSRAELRELFQSGDREAARAKMTELRKATDEKVLAVLTDDQRAQFEAIKGAPFQLPEGALRGGFGPGGRGRGGEDQPRRPARAAT